MALSASEVAKRGPRTAGIITPDWRTTHGFTTLAFEQKFGSAHAPGPGVIRNKTELWYPGGNWWSRYEHGPWTKDNESNNLEMAVFRDLSGHFPSSQSQWGELHEFTPDSIRLYCRLDPWVNSTKRMADAYLQQQDGGTYNLGIGSIITLPVGVGKDLKVDADPKISRYYLGPSYGPAKGGRGTCLAYDPVTGMGTFKITAHPNGSTGGVQTSIRVIHQCFESGTLALRVPSAFPSQYMLWEFGLRDPFGKGNWCAVWWFKQGAWPPEKDPKELFRDNENEVGTIHFHHITGRGSTSQRSRATMNYRNSNLEMNWKGLDLTAGRYTMFDLFEPEYYVGGLNGHDAVTRPYEWRVERDWVADPLYGFTAKTNGDPQQKGILYINFAIGPSDSGYRPINPTNYPCYQELMYIRGWTRSPGL